MDKPTEPSNVAGPRFRLADGWTILEQWAQTAGQTQKNAVHKALLAVTDGTVLRDYVVFDDVNTAEEFTVLLKEDLLLRIALRGLDEFDIRYVGPAGSITDPIDVNRRDRIAPEL
jgi:hypothetical protein